MLKRVVSALIGVVILLAVYLLKNDVVFNLAVTIISILGLNEFYHAVRQKNIRPIEIVGYICCLLLCLVGFVDNEKVLLPAMVMAMPTLLFVVSFITVLSNLKININDITNTIFGIAYVPLMFLFLILTWQLKNGYLLIWFILGGAWITDTFAYLVGKSIGKHKFSKISPNKSIEGCIGGIIGGALFFGLYSHYLNTNFLNLFGGVEFNITIMTILGAVTSVISQIGDFVASSIKRNCEIKDFGSIMPGHGGILDRFDSIIMISPFIYFLFQFII